MATWEIYALRYAGPVESSGAVTLWNRAWDETHQRAYYIWCLKGPGGPVVVDTGISPKIAAEREVPGYENPAQLLARLGVEAAKVPNVVLTHMHWDHASGVGLFPSAQVHVNRKEWEFWRHDPVARRPLFRFLQDQRTLDTLDQVEAQGRLVLHQGDEDLLPGVELIEAPGHTPGLMALAVTTAAGQAVVGSDCGHTYANYQEDWPSLFICDLPDMLRSMDKLKALAANPRLLFPGHDLAMSNEFPEVAPGVTRLA